MEPTLFFVLLGCESLARDLKLDARGQKGQRQSSRLAAHGAGYQVRVYLTQLRAVRPLALAWSRRPVWPSMASRDAGGSRCKRGGGNEAGLACLNGVIKP